MDHKNLKEYINQDNTDALPFISTITMNDGTVTKGIVINVDKHFLSFYNIVLIIDEPTLYDFVELCLDWWWYSNQRIPINLFYADAIHKYESIIEHYPMKGIKTIEGHTTSLVSIMESCRPYRKTITVGQEK